jgi:hypothetical protein
MELFAWFAGIMIGALFDPLTMFMIALSGYFGWHTDKGRIWLVLLAFVVLTVVHVAGNPRAGLDALSAKGLWGLAAFFLVRAFRKKPMDVLH